MVSFPGIVTWATDTAVKDTSNIRIELPQTESEQAEEKETPAEQEERQDQRDEDLQKQFQAK